MYCVFLDKYLFSLYFLKYDSVVDIKNIQRIGYYYVLILFYLIIC